MKRSDQETTRLLAKALQDSTPDVLPQVLLRIREGAANTMTENTNQSGAALDYVQQNKKNSRNFTRIMGSIAAGLLVVIGIYYGYFYMLPQAIIGLDVNPSIEIEVNRAEKVLKIEALNAEAATVIGDMNLKNVDLDIAVNALIGSMVKNGYVTEIKNSILISVNSNDAKKGLQLEQQLSDEVSAMLNAYSVNGAVLSQTVAKTTSLQELAATYNISLGKAKLVEELVSQDDTLDFATIASLPINDINLLMNSRQAQLPGVATTGQASSGSYIGAEKAKEIVLKHAGATAAQITWKKVSLDQDDGVIVYDVDFYWNGNEYEYEVNATNGTIVSYDIERGNVPQAPAGNGNANGNGNGNANSNGNSNSGPDLTTGATPSTGNNGTGNGNGNGTGNSNSNNGNGTGQGNGGTAQGSGNGAHIGAAKAKAIALTKAGASEAAVYQLKVELDRDDGRDLYEVEFTYNNMEYDFDIDAYSGEIVWWESEYDD